MVKLYPISEGIVRLCEETTYGQSLTERYGILNVPAKSAELPFNGRDIPVGNRTFSVRLRPERDDDSWTVRANQIREEFADQLLNKHPIAGDPSRVIAQIPPKNEEKKHFGISVAVSPEARLYGLGEAERNGISIRGKAYQNWVVYQQNEISVPLILSNEGWAMFINCPFRHYVDCCRINPNRLLVLGDEGELDIFFIAAKTMKEALAGYCRLTGMPVLLPKYAYGLTYIMPINATQHDTMTDAREFRLEGIPLDGLSLEPGWMSKNYDFSIDKQWNLDKFFMPDFLAKRDNPRCFLSALRRNGFHLSLWLCVDYDLTAEAERQVTGKPVEGAEAWYNHISKLVDSGVDGFKIDPCSLVDTRHLNDVCANGYTDMQMHNLQNTMLMKQMYEGFRGQAGFRPMLHYCGGYIGIQKYCACTTGDNGGQKGALNWILNLAMVGHMNSTCDMNVFTPESVHFAFLVPWAHLNNWTGNDQPWWAGTRQHQMFTDYARLRYALLPYLYSAAIEGHETGVPMLRPMPLQYPNDDRFADNTTQYMLGDDLMVTAYTDKVVFPEGEWLDYFTGERFAGGSEAAVTIPETRGGCIFVRAGAILPCWSPRNFVTEKSEEEVILHVYPTEGVSTYVFREDDGMSFDFETKLSCHTQITCEKHGQKVQLTIGAREGDYAGKGNRTWKIVLHDDAECTVQSVDPWTR